MFNIIDYFLCLLLKGKVRVDNIKYEILINPIQRASL